MKKILAINGSYRHDGITDQTVAALAGALTAAGAEVESVLLRDLPIEFCLNCRACTQAPGLLPGICVHDDLMKDLIAKIEGADGYILAAPTNFGSVTALFKRFMERLTVYAYWPWTMNSPQLRKGAAAKKKAVLVSSCAAPGIAGRWIYGTGRQLRMTAKVLGAVPVGTLFVGLIAKQPQPQLPPALQGRIKQLAKRLV